jgi:hypothetical protein
MSRYIGDPDMTDHWLCHRPDASPGPAPHGDNRQDHTSFAYPVPFRLVQVPPPPRNILTIRALVKLLGEGGGGCKGPASAAQYTVSLVQ